MRTDGIVKLAGVSYHWYLEMETAEYLGFSHEPINVLRIVGEDPGFDVVVRIRKYPGDPALWGGPIVVLGERFPSAVTAAPKGARIRLRPKISKFRDHPVDGGSVARIIAWCTSSHFRSVRADMSGMPQSSPQDDYSIGAKVRIFDVRPNKSLERTREG